MPKACQVSLLRDKVAKGWGCQQERQKIINVTLPNMYDIIYIYDT